MASVITVKSVLSADPEVSFAVLAKAVNVEISQAFGVFTKAVPLRQTHRCNKPEKH